MLLPETFCGQQRIVICCRERCFRRRHAQKLTRFIGPSTKIMRKAKMSFQSGQVKQVIRTYAVEVQTSDKKDLEADAVTMKLRKAMGANCKTTVQISQESLLT